MTRKLTIAPAASRIGDTATRSWNGVPSMRTLSIWVSQTWPLSSAFHIAWYRSESAGGSAKSGIVLPRVSAAEQPVRTAELAFTYSTTPSGSVMRTASRDWSIAIAKRARASSARRRSVMSKTKPSTAWHAPDSP